MHLTRANVLLYLVYGAVNVLCIAFQVTSAVELELFHLSI